MQLESKAKTSLIINIILIMHHNSCQNVIFRQKNNVQQEGNAQMSHKKL